MNAGTAPSPSSPNRASARSPSLGTGSGSTGSTSGSATPASVPAGPVPALSVPALPVSVLPEVPAGSWPAGTPSAAGRAGRSTLRTEDSDTPVAAAIAALPAPWRSSSRICAITCGVSFEARCGPLAAGTRPATPPPASAFAHRHTLTGITPNACATCTCVAAFSWTSWTAASRRAASSPASHANVASPCTHTTPLPSGPLTTPTPGAISAASCGRSGSGTWVSIRAIIPPPPAAANLSSIIAEMWRRSKPRGTGKGIKDQISRPATPRNQAAMSGALDPGRQ